jgi:alkanesulfonate monooxygenase SsuD/methylene tetrahydromethanopterin reductase-like flavin-dependent oxidoreductase (luciferase family)
MPTLPWDPRRKPQYAVDSPFTVWIHGHSLGHVLIGVNVPNFGPGTNPATLRDWARTVEGLGFDLLMVSDHVVVTPDVAEQYPAPFYEPFTTLSWLAGVTERITLGTTVLIAPYRHPLLVARMAANLSELSGERLVLGVGVGWARQEFAALGVPFHQRGKLTDEMITAVREAWRDADYRAGHIPIWVGGHSDGALRRVVRLGDAWHPLRQTPEDWQESLARLKKVAAAQEKPLPALAPRILLRLTDEPPADRRLGEGTIEQVVGDLRRLRADGAHAVVLDPYAGDPEQTRHPETPWHALATVRKELL